MQRESMKVAGFPPTGDWRHSLPHSGKGGDRWRRAGRTSGRAGVAWSLRCVPIKNQSTRGTGQDWAVSSGKVRTRTYTYLHVHEDS